MLLRERVRCVTGKDLMISPSVLSRLTFVLFRHKDPYSVTFKTGKGGYRFVPLLSLGLRTMTVAQSWDPLHHTSAMPAIPLLQVEVVEGQRPPLPARKIRPAVDVL